MLVKYFLLVSEQGKTAEQKKKKRGLWLEIKDLGIMKPGCHIWKTETANFCGPTRSHEERVDEKIFFFLLRNWDTISPIPFLHSGL